MKYSPCWESLADALDRVILSGLKDAEAKEQLARAIADRRVAARAVIDMSDPDIPGQCLEGTSLTVPDRLVSENLDWSSSRPLAAWETGPGNVGSSITTWKCKARKIKLLEVSTGDVTSIWCSAVERFARQRAAQNEPAPDLPHWFSPMEAIAWLVSRDQKIVGYADPQRHTIRTYFVEHKLLDGERVGFNESVPPGITLGWLDGLAARDSSALFPSDKAMSELLNALRTGRLIARAIWVATGERRDMDSDEWRSLTLESPEHNKSTLLPYRANPGILEKQPEKRWEEILFPKQRLLELWPARDETTAVDLRLEEMESQGNSALQRFGIEETRGRPGKPPPVALAKLTGWYEARRDNWPSDRKHPNEAEDLTDARENFPHSYVTRDSIRTLRARLAPKAWTGHGRRKLAR